MENQSDQRTHIRQATLPDVKTVAAILSEAAHWLQAVGMPMWRDNELIPAVIADEVNAGLFFLAENAGEPAGTVKFQLEDPLFWPDLPPNQAAYIHRLAVRRPYAGQGVSTALMQWAVARTRSLGRAYLRLDCEASRARLRTVYERFGFQHHSDRQVGPYFVSRYQYKTV